MAIYDYFIYSCCEKGHVLKNRSASRVDLNIFICICDCQNYGGIRLKVKRDKDDARKPSKILE